jgi:hypothetical protein
MVNISTAAEATDCSKIYNGNDALCILDNWGCRQNLDNVIFFYFPPKIWWTKATQWHPIRAVHVFISNMLTEQLQMSQFLRYTHRVAAKQIYCLSPADVKWIHKHSTPYCAEISSRISNKYYNQCLKQQHHFIQTNILSIYICFFVCFQDVRSYFQISLYKTCVDIFV